MTHSSVKLFLKPDRKKGPIAHLILDRPSKGNAINQLTWDDLENHLEALDNNPDIRVVIISGEGQHFCSGLDMMQIIQHQKTTAYQHETSMREKLRLPIIGFSQGVQTIANFHTPVIAAIHGACIGIGVDIALACDLRFATEDAYFMIEEIDIEIADDVGTIERLLKLVGDGVVRELTFTGRKLYGKEARAIGIANNIYPNKNQLMKSVMKSAEQISKRMPAYLSNTKKMLNYFRDHSVEDGLDFITYMGKDEREKASRWKEQTSNLD